MWKRHDPFKKMAFVLKNQYRKVRHREYNIPLKGDRSQREIQKQFLEEKGFEIGYSKLRPGLGSKEEYKEALTLIWQNRIKGWWRYKRGLIKNDICTADEFQKAHQEYFEGDVEKWFRKWIGRWF